MPEPAVPVLTLDGPSGSGKGAVSRRVAAALGWHLLDSGALYRVVALLARRAGLDLADAPAVAAVAHAMQLRFSSRPDGEELILLLPGGEDITSLVRSEETGAMASRVAALPPVRAALLQRQRDFAQQPGLVADGRDMGTVVFPLARIKVFLTASAAERAARRYKQLKEKDSSVTLQSLSREIAERDARDAARTVAPLMPAADAWMLDSTQLGLDEVVARVLDRVRAAGVGIAGG
ncbi:MAG: hypothetical protein RL026_2655 [Pseudomonadota bacterium]|jgi:cytidylate kinase